MIPTRVSSPGKLILVGDHAAVYRRPAVVAALGARLEARFSEAGSGVELILRDLGEHVHVDLDELEDYTMAARRHWQEFDKDPSPTSFRRLRGEDPAHLAKVAVGEALAFAGARDACLLVEVSSELPVGSGFGSSAALSATLVVGTLAALEVDADASRLEALVTEAERRQHGHPSGVDAAVVLRGGVQWIEYPTVGALRAVALREGTLLSCLRVVDTGTPEVATGEVVAAVSRRSSEQPRVFDSALRNIQDAAKAFRSALEANDGDLLARAIYSAERALEELGVVPAVVVDLVRRIEAAGGAAKISGAGASHGDRAGGLVVYHPRPEEVADWDFLPSAWWVHATLGAPSVRREASQ
ncbi:MAG: hypothetical protein VYE73_00215 [Acidobacteriota bacterium]|nr:hypothetical protein [Acidobacteriota bacterium]